MRQVLSSSCCINNLVKVTEVRYQPCQCGFNAVFFIIRLYLPLLMYRLKKNSCIGWGIGCSMMAVSSILFFLFLHWPPVLFRNAYCYFAKEDFPKQRFQFLFYLICPTFFMGENHFGIYPQKYIKMHRFLTRLFDFLASVYVYIVKHCQVVNLVAIEILCNAIK